MQRFDLSNLALRFPEPYLERDFEEYYTHTYSVVAQVALWLGLVLLLADFLADFFLSPSGRQSGNMLRLELVAPVLLGAIVFTHVPLLKQSWQMVMGGFVVLASTMLFIALAKIDVDGGYGLTSWVGALNFTFATTFCFVVLGIQFRVALLHGTVILFVYLLFVGLQLSVTPRALAYYSYHAISLYVLLAGIGYFRELFIRRDFRSWMSAEHERKRSDDMLYNVLPATVADRIKAGEFPIADSYGEATVLFADLRGFISLASKFGPRHLVEILNEIFVAFDQLCSKHGMEKVKTIGDAYMAVSGAIRYSADHASAAVATGLDMVEFITDYARRHEFPIRLRVGIHSGAVIGGVIGKSKYHYDFWGDTVEIASRLESSGEESAVQISETTYWHVRETYSCEPNADIDIRGKGTIKTYLIFPPIGYESARVDLGIPRP